MKRLHPSSFILHPSPDPEDQMQEHGSRFASLVLWTFLILGWVLGVWSLVFGVLRRHGAVLLLWLFYTGVGVTTVLIVLHYTFK